MSAAARKSEPAPKKKACKGRTKQGYPCRGTLTGDNEYCRAHGGAWTPVPVTARCAGTNNTGARCHTRVQVEGDYCGEHGWQRRTRPRRVVQQWSR